MECELNPFVTTSTASSLRRRALHAGFAGLLVALFLLGSSLAAAAEAALSFDLPAGEAAQTLKQFAVQANREIVFATNAVSGVTTHAVKGEMTAATALDQMLIDTGLVATVDSKSGAFAVKLEAKLPEKNVESRRADDAAAGTGSIEGRILAAEEPVVGARVSVLGLPLFTLTDRFGAYRIDDVPAGAQALVVDGEHIARVKVTGVLVKSHRSMTLATINAPARSRDLMAQTEQVVAAEKLDEVVQMDRFDVYGRKPAPYTGANVDLPRTENDPQPYFIYDSASIERSGAVSVVDFMQKFVPMNYRKGTTEQNPIALNGASSIFSLFGPVGQSQTLVLVNGRPQANVLLTGSPQQPDVNGIPLAAIDRIEILPASASAIYGGSALGGVINIVLKQNYVGGEIRLNYENSFGTDAPVKSTTVMGGLSLEGGRTHLFVSASYSDRQPMLLQDIPFLQDYLKRWTSALYTANDPGSPPLGATANVTTGDSTITLTLKRAYGGADLGTSITYVPTGYRGVATSGVAALAANAGKYNTNLANTTASATYDGYGAGLRTPLITGARLRGLSLSLRRQMLARLELYANFDFRSNRSYSDYSSGDGIVVTLPVDAPTNPFASEVYVNLPIANRDRGFTSLSESRDFVFGAKLDLPFEWTALTEFHHSENAMDYTLWTYDSKQLTADAKSGAFDPLEDLVGQGIDLTHYRGRVVSGSFTALNEVTARASGPIWHLPGGTVQGSTILSTQKQANHPSQTLTSYDYYPNDFTRVVTLTRQSVDDSAAMEITAPVFGQKFTYPLLRSLDLQFAGRYDNYHAHQSSYVRAFTATVTSPAINRSKSRYHSDNETYGITWKPVRDVMFRAAYSKAFTPPDPSNLLLTTLTTPYQTKIFDPLRGNASYSVSYLGSGNPDLKPETSDNETFGVVVTPRWVPGLRLSVDYSRINRANTMGSLSAQQLIDDEAYFPDRITRAAPVAGDTYSVGKITFVDTRYLNLLKTQTETYNLRADYSLRTKSYGNWMISGVGSVLEHYRLQPAFGALLTEQIGNEKSGSYLVPKFKGNLSLTWDLGPWSAGWTTTFSGHYVQSILYQPAQGGRYVPSQTYHDVFVGYQFRSAPGSNRFTRALLDNTSVEVGVKNVFNTKPPFDAVASSGLPYSVYGDLRLATYWLSLKKSF